MPHIKVLAAAVAIGLAATLALGRLPLLDPQVQDLRRSAAVSASFRQLLLSDDNLADAVASLNLHHRITRVGWDHSILTLDLTLRETGGEASALWRDMATLIRFSFGEAANVHQTLIRVYRVEDGRKWLLFYGDPRKADWTENRLAELRTPDHEPDEPFRLRIRLAATPAGERWLQNLANS